MNGKMAANFGCMVLALAAMAVPQDLVAQGSGTDFKILKRFPLEGNGRWDYMVVEPGTNRFFLSRATHTMVLNAETGEKIGDIPDTPGVHGIALAPELGIGFISDGGGNKVTVFDLKTLATVTTIDTEKNPDSIMFHPPSNSVYVMNGNSKSATVIDATTKTVKATIPMPGRPEYSQYDGNDVYVNIEDTSSLVDIDTTTNKIKNTWSLAPCDSPSGQAIDVKDHLSFSVCDNKIMTVFDYKAAKVIQTVPVGQECDADRYDPATGMVFASGNDGTMTIIKKGAGNKFSVVQSLKTQLGSKTMEYNPANQHIYLPAAKFNGDVYAHPRPPVVEGSAELLVIGQ